MGNMLSCTYNTKCTSVNDLHVAFLLPYPRERGPMGSVPYIGPRLGDGPIFEVSVLHLDTKECPGICKLPMLSS